MSSMSTVASTQYPETHNKNDNVVLDYKLLEDELELQLSLLKESNTPDSNFQWKDPNDNNNYNSSIETSSFLPPNVVKDSTPTTATTTNQDGIFHKPSASEILEFEETVLEENLLEPFFICLAIAGFALIPQLLH